jgi:PRTRC genetic system protein E
MTTNFFQNIASLNLPGTWNIVIATDEQGNFTVSELFKATCGDKAKDLIIPYTLNGTAQDLDEGFFDKITEPVIKAAQLQTNMEAHLKSVELAKAASKIEQDKKTKEAKTTTATAKRENNIELPDPKAEKKKAYETAMKQVADLSAECKYAEALELLPSATDYPDKETELKNKKTELLRNKEFMAQATLQFNV